MKEKNLSFYKFPSQVKQQQRRAMWIAAVKRMNPDGTKWIPKSEYTYLCNKHFITGRLKLLLKY